MTGSEQKEVKRVERRRKMVRPEEVPTYWYNWYHLPQGLIQVEGNPPKAVAAQVKLVRGKVLPSY